MKLTTSMDATNAPQSTAPRRERRSSRERMEGSTYKDVASKAVYQEADVKKDMGPSVSMTVVGESVEFTQHFHF
jgi:hypothetical protein